MSNIKQQIKAVKSKIRNPEIGLNEKVMDNIKDLTIDDEVKVSATLKVIEVSRENDYDVSFDDEAGEKRPKILRARFEVKDIKKIK